jgi:hypothetical protein
MTPISFILEEPRLVTAMSADHKAPPEAGTERPVDDQYLAVLRLIERHLGRIANVLETLSPEPMEFVKDLGAVRGVPRPKDR